MVSNTEHEAIHVCPFCDYEPPVTGNPEAVIYDLAYHIELSHREPGSGPSEFEAADPLNYSGTRPRAPSQASGRRSVSPSISMDSQRRVHTDREVDYVSCPRDCGEMIAKDLLDQHLSLHQAEDIALDELEGQYHAVGSTHGKMSPEDDDAVPVATENGGKKTGSHKLDLFRDIFNSSLAEKIHRKPIPQKPGQRLGRKELGPHAYEERMPSWLLKQLRDGPPLTWIDQIGPDGRLQRVERVANETPGLVIALARLCRQDRSVSKAWLCSPGVKHIFKTRREGGFCGYRNIQMQVSWMQHHDYPGAIHFGRSTPNILDLQVMIEQAWESGINSTGKTETGGIIGTRKYIGTPEAQALFHSLGIQTNAQALTRNKIPERKDPVYAALLEYVLEYFSKDVIDPTQKVYMTSLPPIYFQHPGHSLTIVGIEIHKNGNINLLVFDPMFPTVPVMIRYLGTNTDASNPSKILKSFRRGEDYLKKYKSFEVLSLAVAAKSRQEQGGAAKVAQG